MAQHELSFTSRKALCVHLGESAGTEIASVIQQLIERIDKLERTKVDVTPIVPLNSPDPTISNPIRPTT